MNTDKSDEIDVTKKVRVGNSKDKTTPNFVPKRNAWLLRLFQKLFPKNDIRIMGDENNPAVIIDHEFILSCYVSNFDVRFTNKSHKADVLFEVKLKDDIKDIKTATIKENNEPKEVTFDDALVDNWYKNSQHRKLNRVYLECENTQAPLYLIGWNFRNKVSKEGKYPVFGECEPKVYFTKERASEVQEELIQMGYNVIVI